MRNRSLRAMLVLAVAIVAVLAGSAGVALALPIPVSLNLHLQPGAGNASDPFGNMGGSSVEWFNKAVSIASTPTLSIPSTTTLIPASYLAYSLNGSAFTSITASPLQTFGAEGIYSFDATGSLVGISYEGTSTFGIDMTRPMSSSNAVPVYDATATITITATDTLSGPEYIVYSLDGASDYATPTPDAQTLSADVAVTAPGAHTLSWFSVDNAGNHERWHSVSFLVNATGYTPVLGRPKVSVYKKRKGRLSGSVTAAATDRTLTFTQMRKSGKSWKASGTAQVTIRKYASTYAFGLRFTKAGTYRVRAAEGAGVSAWSKEYKVK